MFEAPSQSDGPDALSASLGRVRVAGGVDLRVEARGGRSFAADLLERDGYKIRFPRGGAHTEAVIINTGGGLAGGDRVRQSVALGEGAEATVTTQSAERVYRALGDSETAVDIRLALGEAARLNWLPQETILFDEARLRRSIEVDMAASSRVLLAETVIFGRTAMGETIRSGLLRDRWRVRCGTRLVFAETVRLEGGIAELLAQTPIAGGAHVVSTLVAVRQDAGDLLAGVRAALQGAECEAGASAWGMLLVLRALGRSSENVRGMLERAIPVLSDAPLPRVWQT
jgi:urease accessory protein